MDTDISSEPIGDIVRSNRIRKGMTQRQLAELSTVSIRAIRDLEAGRTFRPHPHTINLLLSALGLRRESTEVSERSAGARHPGVPRQDLGRAEPPRLLDTTIGRDDEILALCDTLVVDDCRLVEVTGLPGVGKTQMAIAAADLLATAGLRVVWVQVQHEPTRVRADRSRPWQLSSGAQGAVSYQAALVGEEPALVVLDGCEPSRQHTGRVSGVLRRYPRARVLVTTRAPLGIPGERVVPLAPLAVPDLQNGDLDGITRNPAVQALVRSVRRTLPMFELTPANAATVAELCRRLDGLPGLLTAVASAFLLFGPDALSSILSSDPAALLAEVAPEFITAVRSIISMMDDREVALLNQTADWSVDDIASLGGVSRMAAARQVRRLVERGLVRLTPATSGVRFRVLETIRAVKPHPD